MKEGQHDHLSDKRDLNAEYLQGNITWQNMQIENMEEDKRTTRIYLFMKLINQFGKGTIDANKDIVDIAKERLLRDLREL